MKRLYMHIRAFCLLMAVLIILSGCAAAESSAGILYRVTGGKNELALLGSIHIGSEAMYPVGSHIQDALEASDTLVFECDTQSDAAQKAMLGMMAYPSGDSLRAHVSDECYELLEQATQKAGYSMAYLNALKPWAVMSMLSLESTYALLGTRDIRQAMELGVETQIGLMAGGKPQIWLEETQRQLDMLDGFSDGLQEYLLMDACRAIVTPEAAGGMDADMRLWPQWWHDGDAEAFAESYTAGMASEQRQDLIAEYRQSLVTERNIDMAQRLSQLLEADEPHSYFATIGLLHLVLPDDSVICELENMGYTVTRVWPD
ncbi:MAG: TraB/GumN family protein [Clostridiales bacterium]|nr:TraB/GumN family protein [Clostridiales bacterium]MDO4349771.1 TraB/GumN family protein [Eubacteriales bacterium]MDY4008067.1 TraB/GumN family protein [Candidatus Limiplasma sp.]